MILKYHNKTWKTHAQLMPLDNSIEFKPYNVYTRNHSKLAIIFLLGLKMYKNMGQSMFIQNTQNKTQ